MDPRIAFLERPQGMGKGGEIIDKRDGVAVPGQVNGAQIKLARIAGFNANMRRIFGDIDWQFVFGFFAAGGAKDPAKFPFLRTEGAEQESFAAVSFGAQPFDTGPFGANDRTWPDPGKAEGSPFLAAHDTL